MGTREKKKQEGDNRLTGLAGSALARDSTVGRRRRLFLHTRTHTLFQEERGEEKREEEEESVSLSSSKPCLAGAQKEREGVGSKVRTDVARCACIWVWY